MCVVVVHVFVIVIVAVVVYVLAIASELASISFLSMLIVLHCSTIDLISLQSNCKISGSASITASTAPEAIHNNAERDG